MHPDTNQITNPKSWWNDLSDLFYPVFCVGCNGPVRRGEAVLCTACLSELPKTNYHLEPNNPILLRLAGRIPLSFGWAYLKFRKSGLVQHLLHQLKYQQHPEIGVTIGRVFGNELARHSLQQNFDLIIPVPLHPRRMRERGYNQSACFAEGLAAATGVPWNESIAVRTLHASTQTKKSRVDRWTNVGHAFRVAEPEALYGRRVLLVDDVITTGATLEACGREIVEAGCANLGIACIAEAQ